MGPVLQNTYIPMEMDDFVHCPIIIMTKAVGNNYQGLDVSMVRSITVRAAFRNAWNLFFSRESLPHNDWEPCWEQGWPCPRRKGLPSHRGKSDQRHGYKSPAKTWSVC